MKHVLPVILVLAAMICGISTAALNANHVFDGRIWIAWCGYGLTAALLLIAAIIAVLNSKREREKDNRPAPPPPPPQQQTQSNEQKVTQEIHIGQELLRQFRNEHKLEPPHPSPVSQKPTPNIHFVESKSVDVYPQDDHDLVETQDNLGEYRVAVARFRNDGVPGREFQEPRVRAHIIYRDADGNEITDVAVGVWLAEYKDHVRFDLGAKRSVVVCLLTKQGTLKRLWKEEYTHEHSWMGGPSYRIKDERITGEIDSVEIQLLSESKGSCLFRAVLKAEAPRRDGELPKFALSSAAAGLTS